MDQRIVISKHLAAQSHAHDGVATIDFVEILPQPQKKLAPCMVGLTCRLCNAETGFVMLAIAVEDFVGHVDRPI